MQGLEGWNDRNVNPSLGRCLFSFVLIADTHVDRENLPTSSPFAVNAFANARTRYCIEDIKTLQGEMGGLAPKFVLHLGDLTHPVPAMPAYATAVKDFKNIVAELEIPLYLLPGNHDVGDKPVDWAPAGVVCNKYLADWDHHFGRQFQAFHRQGVKFILINAQLINSGLEIEKIQREWLERTLLNSVNERIMLFSHYPPYLSTPDEHENYDNLAEPGRSWLLELTKKHAIEALFSGHVHHFWYNRYESMDCYLLPSTSFTRQDYSEMFRIAPTEEMVDGRNDVAKVGYFIVLVYENGHVCHFRTTMGRTISREEQPDPKLDQTKVVSLHPRETIKFPVGFDMRHPWNELTQIAPSGALDEFRRKVVRNDYPLLAMWQMGAGLMRIPIEDLECDRTVDRMQSLRESNHEFVVISQGIPSANVCSNLIRHRNLIRRWDITVALNKIESVSAVIRRVKTAVNFPVYLSKLRMKDDDIKEGKPYFHQISHGFSSTESNEIEAILADSQYQTLFDGFVFRIEQGDSVSQSLTGIEMALQRFQQNASVTLFMADRNPARYRCDDEHNANAITEGVFAAAALQKIELFVDTFMDLDRGHSVRNGVIDRLCNPRPAMLTVRHLSAILASVTNFSGQLVDRDLDGGSGRWVSVTCDRKVYLLYLPKDHHRTFSTLELNRDNISIAGAGEAVNLLSGDLGRVLIEPTNNGIELSFANTTAGPLFIRVDISG